MAITPPTESYITGFAVDSPASSLRILSLHDLGTQARGILEIRPADGELQSLVRFLESTEAIVSCDVLYSDADIGLVQYTTREPVVYLAALEAGATPIFPVEISNGQLLIEAPISYDRLSRFEVILQEIDASYELLSIRQSPKADELLTTRQQQFVLEAVRRGYYDTPRQCTLTELAELLAVTKGAASGLLHRAEEQIVKEFVASLSGES